jgi:hypothetical protein
MRTWRTLPASCLEILHGTQEAPAFVKAPVCQPPGSDRAVLPGLEQPSQEQRFLDDLLHAPADNVGSALLANPFWSRPSQDGRTSCAMLALLQWVRQLVAGGARIRVRAFDALPVPAPGQGPAASFDARDAAMAATLDRELATLGPQEVPVIFAGNVSA